MDISYYEQDRILVLELREPLLNGENGWVFRDQAVSIIEKNDRVKVVLNLACLLFMDPQGFGALLSVLRAVHLKGGEIKLCGLKTEVRRLVQIVSGHKLFEIYDSSEEAIRSFRLIVS